MGGTENNGLKRKDERDTSIWPNKKLSTETCDRSIKPCYATSLSTVSAKLDLEYKDRESRILPRGDETAAYESRLAQNKDALYLRAKEYPDITFQPGDFIYIYHMGNVTIKSGNKEMPSHRTAKALLDRKEEYGLVQIQEDMLLCSKPWHLYGQQIKKMMPEMICHLPVVLCDIVTEYADDWVLYLGLKSISLVRTYRVDSLVMQFQKNGSSNFNEPAWKRMETFPLIGMYKKSHVNEEVVRGRESQNSSLIIHSATWQTKCRDVREFACTHLPTVFKPDPSGHCADIGVLNAFNCLFSLGFW